MQSVIGMVQDKKVLILLIILAAAAAFYVYEKEKPSPQVESYEMHVESEDIKGTESTESEQFISSSLLPKNDEIDKDNDIEFAPTPDLSGMNFVDRRWEIGTQSQVNRNPNLSIRPDPQIPEVETGPWNQGTIEKKKKRRGAVLQDL